MDRPALKEKITAAIDAETGAKNAAAEHAAQTRRDAKVIWDHYREQSVLATRADRAIEIIGVDRTQPYGDDSPHGGETAISNAVLLGEVDGVEDAKGRNHGFAVVEATRQLEQKMTKRKWLTANEVEYYPSATTAFAVTLYAGTREGEELLKLPASVAETLITTVSL